MQTVNNKISANQVPPRNFPQSSVLIVCCDELWSDHSQPQPIADPKERGGLLKEVVKHKAKGQNNSDDPIVDVDGVVPHMGKSGVWVDNVPF